MDMELDDFAKPRTASQRGKGQGWRRRDRSGSFHRRGATGQGPLRVTSRRSSYSVAKSFSRAKDLFSKHDMYSNSMAAVGISGSETGTKLYISNLDFGVSNGDIKELFSEIGHLEHSAVHYDQNGRPSGLAEVIFTRRSDALAAVKRYNNVRLDGRPMRIEVIGTNLGLPITPRINVAGGAMGTGKRTVIIRPGFGRRASFKPISGVNKKNSQRGSGNGRGKGRGQARARGRGVKRNLLKSAEDLDKELDKYHAEAKP